jgi:speckle-type POZ protein
MEIAAANLTQVVRSLRLLKIEGYSMIQDMSSDDCFNYKWIFDGYEWEIRVYPSVLNSTGLEWFVAVRLIFLSEPRGCAVRTTLRCSLVGPRRVLCDEHRETIIFRKSQDSSEKIALTGEGYIDDDSFSVQCMLEVFKELPDIRTVSFKELHLPSSNLHQHLGELLQSQTGADVTFLVSGESFAAHKAILAARSPVLMAEFFGEMKETRSPCVEIKDMEAAAFKAMLHFIYTDMVPDLGDKQSKTVVVMAQHLLVAADRYGLGKLKLICERKLTGGISVGTAATTLVLAEQHNCSLLKAKCLEFIVRTVATLDAVMATEGYRHLEASCPLVLRELLKSARGRKRS